MGQLNNSNWEHVDISALIAATKWNGVVSGLSVSESTTPAMTVLVATGSCIVDDVKYTESSSQNLNISNGHATHPRKDIVVYDTSAGNPAVVEGTPAAAPVPPDIPSGDIYLAMVHVDANETTSVVNADIDEGRVFIRDYHHTTHELGGTDHMDGLFKNYAYGILPTNDGGWTTSITGLSAITDNDNDNGTTVGNTSLANDVEITKVDLGSLLNIDFVTTQLYAHGHTSATDTKVYVETSSDDITYATIGDHASTRSSTFVYYGLHGVPPGKIRYIRVRAVQPGQAGLGSYYAIRSIKAFGIA